MNRRGSRSIVARLMRRSVRLVAVIGLAVGGGACGGHTEDDGPDVGDSGVPIAPTANPAREILDTQLVVDVTQLVGTATITFAASTDGASLEIGDLMITSVTANGEALAYAVNGKQLDLALPGSSQPRTVEIVYGFKLHEKFDGVSVKGFTFVWPYYCGNVFPCHSRPADGTTFTLALDGVPQAKTAIYPAAIDADAPSYMLAWAVGAYTKRELGTTAAGTKVSTAWLPGGETAALAGTKHLVAAFDWYERNLGPYSFGHDVASVSVVWGEGMYGGMEHHPYWHVAVDAMGDEVTHVHEAAHGWFGDGVRLRCWEDFVLSEGTVSYLAARVLGKVAGAAKEASVWAEYQQELDAAIAEGGAPAWPQGCNQIDILRDKLFTNLPYMQGAFFYKDVAAQIGADQLDRIIGDFYRAHRNQPAGMQQMIDAIKAASGFDPTPIAEARLRTRF